MIKRLLKADIVYTSAGQPIENGMVAIATDGRIAAIGQDIASNGIEVEYFKGALCPAFVNTHCHLELSHLKNKLPQKTGLDGFIKNLQANRVATQEEITTAIEVAEKEMQAAGIVAVGDICNGTDSFQTKKNSAIYFYNFIELFANNPEKASTVFFQGKEIQNSSKLLGLNSSIVPHSPYSVSKKLFKLIDDENKNSPLSIHNQETASENELYQKGSGKLAELLKSFGTDLSTFEISNRNSLPSYLSLISPTKPLLLVHNTYTELEDIQFAEKMHSQLYWCFCPKANLHIENQLPDFSVFISEGVKCTLGTDSLASNDTLSIFEEMKVIQANCQAVSLDLLIRWATINGAEFLGIEKEYGSLEVGKQAKINRLKLNKGKLFEMEVIV